MQNTALKVFICLLCLTVLCGCKEKGAELEKYHSGEEKIEQNAEKYEYLTSIILKESSASLRVWIPDSNTISKKENQVSSQNAGIEVETELLENSSESIQQLCEAKVSEKQNEINAFAGVKDVAVTGDSSSGIAMINYNIRDGGSNIYPCAVIIKAENIEEGYYLRTSVTVDNTSANENTKKILAEVLDAFGIELSN